MHVKINVNSSRFLSKFHSEKEDIESKMSSSRFDRGIDNVHCFFEKKTEKVSESFGKRVELREAS